MKTSLQNKNNNRRSKIMKNKISRFSALSLAVVAMLAIRNAPLSNALAQSASSWSTNELPAGLIAWWPAEGNLLDVAGNHNGTGSTAPTYAPGRFGQAFQFNGVDQSVAIPNVYPDLDGWTQFTLEAWFNADNVADAPTPGPGRTIFSKVGNATDHSNFNQGYQFGWYGDGTKLILLFNTNGQAWPGIRTIANLAAPLLTNQWYHFVGTYDHNAVKIYLNGVLLTNNVIGPVTIQNSGSTLRISKDDNLNVPFAGRIDDPRIYQRALSSAEIAYLYAGPVLPVTNGVKLHFDANNVHGDGSIPADGATVSTWRDIGGLGLDLSPLFGVAPVFRTNAVNGRAGVDFSQSGSALASADSAQLDFTNCTIFMVANRPDGNCHVSISAPCVHQEFAVGTTAIYHHAYPFHYTYRSHQDSPANYYVQAGVFGVQANQLDNWINGVLSTNGFGFGQQSPTFADVPDYAQVARQAILGWRNTDAYCNAPIALENFNGVICEVLVYDRQLNPEELGATTAYLAGKYNLPLAFVRPVLQANSLTGGTVTLQWVSTAGQRYQLQSTTNLSTASWLNEGTPFTGTGGVLTKTIPSGTEPTKYFRLLLFGN